MAASFANYVVDQATKSVWNSRNGITYVTKIRQSEKASQMVITEQGPCESFGDAALSVLRKFKGLGETIKLYRSYAGDKDGLIDYSAGLLDGDAPLSKYNLPETLSATLNMFDPVWQIKGALISLQEEVSYLHPYESDMHCIRQVSITNMVVPEESFAKELLAINLSKANPKFVDFAVLLFIGKKSAAAESDPQKIFPSAIQDTKSHKRVSLYGCTYASSADLALIVGVYANYASWLERRPQYPLLPKGSIWYPAAFTTYYLARFVSCLLAWTLDYSSIVFTPFTGQIKPGMFLGYMTLFRFAIFALFFAWHSLAQPSVRASLVTVYTFCILFACQFIAYLCTPDVVLRLYFWPHLLIYPPVLFFISSAFASTFYPQLGYRLQEESV